MYHSDVYKSALCKFFDLPPSTSAEQQLLAAQQASLSGAKFRARMNSLLLCPDRSTAEQGNVSCVIGNGHAPSQPVGEN